MKCSNGNTVDNLVGGTFNGICPCTETVHECYHIKFTLAAFVIHVTNFAENFSFFPTHVMDTTDGPHAANIAVRISTVQTVPIIQMDGDSQSFFWALCPF